MRLVHQLAQALATVLAHKRAGASDHSFELLSEALSEATGASLERIRGADRDAVLQLCTYANAFSGEMAAAVASLLMEDDHPASRHRALWLYEECLSAGGVVPFDVYERIAELRGDLESRSSDHEEKRRTE